jgi:hypothetical protein
MCYVLRIRTTPGPTFEFDFADICCDRLLGGWIARFEPEQAEVYQHVGTGCYVCTDCLVGESYTPRANPSIPRSHLCPRDVFHIGEGMAAIRSWFRPPKRGGDSQDRRIFNARRGGEKGNTQACQYHDTIAECTSSQRLKACGTMPVSVDLTEAMAGSSPCLASIYGRPENQEMRRA